MCLSIRYNRYRFCFVYFRDNRHAYLAIMTESDFKTLSDLMPRYDGNPKLLNMYINDIDNLLQLFCIQGPLANLIVCLIKSRLSGAALGATLTESRVEVRSRRRRPRSAPPLDIVKNQICVRSLLGVAAGSTRSRGGVEAGARGAPAPRLRRHFVISFRT